MRCNGILYDRLWNPLLLAALNTDPPEASARLAGAVVRESLALGGKACRPLIAEHGLSRAFVDPALSLLKDKGGVYRPGHRLRRLHLSDKRVEALDFGEGEIALSVDERVVLAVPSWVASGLLPGLAVPSAQRSIVNGHFRIDAPSSMPAMLGVVGGTVEWIFRFPGRISITVSGADRLLDVPREDLAALFWQEICAATGLDRPLPRWQVIKEKRATFAALPEEDKKRPMTRSSWTNLYLAGDYTATGLPATIEGAIRSGFAAADCARSSEQGVVH